MTQSEHRPLVLVIGLGAMGLPMAIRLRAQGWPVAGVDVTDNALARAGSHDVAAYKLGDLPEAVRSATGVVVSSLPEDHHVVAVAQQLAELDFAGRPVLLETSTILPTTLQAVASLMAGHASETVDVAVSGGPDAAQLGSLIVYSSPTEDARARDVLAAVGDRHVACPSLGDAKTVKLLNNAMGWMCTAIGAEVLVLGEKCGLDRQWLYDALAVGNGRSHQFVKRYGRYLSGDHESYFSLAMGEKDARLVVELAEDRLAHTPLSRALHAGLAAATDSQGSEDIAAIIEYYDRMTTSTADDAHN